MNEAIDALRVTAKQIRAILDSEVVPTNEQCEELSSVTDWLHAMSEAAWGKAADEIEREWPEEDANA